MIGAVVFRTGPLLRGLGFAVVAADGLEVSRPRALWRSSVAWSPALTLAAYTLAGVITGFGLNWFLVHGAVGILLAGGALAIIRPERGLQDRLAGTWLVPR